MRMYLDCIPCMFNQGIFASRQTGCPLELQREVVNALARKVPEISSEATPPEIAVDIYRIISELIGVEDPFIEVKKASNEAAMSVYPELVQRLETSEDPLLEAVRIAVLGNIIDYGANTNIDLHDEIRKILDKEATSGDRGVTKLFDLRSFRDALGKAREVLYIGDNAGEIVFDRVLVEVLLRIFSGLKIRYAVRGKPIINDVTMEDAVSVGMDKVCEVVSSGCPAPGAVPSLCSGEFLRLMDGADVIISKGQGNYESLSGKDYPVFYLLKVKCPVIAADIPAGVGDICLFKTPSL